MESHKPFVVEGASSHEEKLIIQIPNRRPTPLADRNEVGTDARPACRLCNAARGAAATTSVKKHGPASFYWAGLPAERIESVWNRAEDGGRAIYSGARGGLAGAAKEGKQQRAAAANFRPRL